MATINMFWVDLGNHKSRAHNNWLEIYYLHCWIFIGHYESIKLCLYIFTGFLVVWDTEVELEVLILRFLESSASSSSFRLHQYGEDEHK